LSITSIVNVSYFYNDTTYSNCTGHLQIGSLAGVAQML